MFRMEGDVITDDIAQAELQKQEIRERLQRLKDDLRVTQEAITRAETALSFLEGYTAALAKIKAPDTAAGEDKGGTDAPDSPRRRVRNPSREEVVDASLAAINEAGVPMSRQQLFQAVTERGIDIQGKNPLMVFSTMLWRTQERIVRLRPYGYWPADKPYPPADYFPAPEQPSLL